MVPSHVLALLFKNKNKKVDHVTSMARGEVEAPSPKVSLVPGHRVLPPAPLDLDCGGFPPSVV